MSYYDYTQSREIAAKGYPFYSLIMAAMRQADSDNAILLKRTWPHVWDELDRRYYAPEGKLPEDRIGHGITLKEVDDEATEADG